MRRLRLKRTLLPFGAALALIAVGAFPAVAQQTGTVRGVVRDASSQEPIVRAQVFVPGTRVTTQTDVEGGYVLPNVRLGRVVVRARALGYTSGVATVTVAAGLVSEVDFTLTQSVIRLDEIVVTGAGGAVQKKQLGNTIATIDAAYIEDAPVMTFSEALMAREPGISVLPSGGLTGEGARIRIRGSSSLSQSNEAVVYLDGVRIDNGGGFGTNVGVGGGGVPSRLDDINPDAIDRVEVLKGSAAATLFGSEANAGVIQIFTKRGEAGRPRFSFRIEQGLSTYPDRYKPNAGFARDQAQADELSAFYGLTLAPFQVFERTNVTDLFETGHSQTYSGSVTGGGDDIQYYVAGRFNREDGPFGGQELGPARDVNRKIQANANITVFPRERLQIRFGSMFTDVHHETPENNNNIYGVVSLAMFAKPELAFCNDPADVVGDGTCAGPGNPTGQIAFATVREAMQSTTEQDAEHFNTNLNIRYQASRAVDFDVTFGADFVNTRTFNFAPFGNDIDKFIGRDVDGFKNLNRIAHRELTLDAKATWEQQFGDLTSSFLAGAQGFITQNKAVGTNVKQFPGPGLEVAGAAASQTATESILEIVNAGAFLQEQVGYRDFVYVTLGGRWDRNSAFGENEGAAFYPKASISFIPSDLASWNSETFSTLRVRGAIGRSGLQPGAFDKFTTFGPGPTSAGPGLVPDNLGNVDLKPEVSTEIEVGAELGLLTNKLGIEGTYWHRKTTDALIARQFAVTGGFRATQLDNIGELKGEGVELKLTALVIDRPDFSVSFFANASYLNETVISLGDAPPIKVSGTYTRIRNHIIEGFAPGAHFGAAPLPFCSDNPVFSGGPNSGSARPCWTPGSTVPYDTNGDGQPDSEAEMLAFLGTAINPTNLSPLIDDEDGDGNQLDHFLGKPQPDWSGSFGTTIEFLRNLQLFTLFAFKTGNYTINNLTDGFRQFHSAIGRNFRQTSEVEATLLNPASTAEQRLEAAMTWANELKALFPHSGLNMMETISLLRWRELSLTYTAPRDWSSRLGLNDLSFTFSGRNIAMFTGYTGIDPEQNWIGRNGDGSATEAERNRDNNFLDGVEAFGFPLPVRWSLAVRFGF